MFRVVLVFCWYFIWVLVELNIIVKEKPCQHSYSQEETKYDYSMKSCVGKQEPRTFELLCLDKSVTTFYFFYFPKSAQLSEIISSLIAPLNLSPASSSLSSKTCRHRQLVNGISFR